MFDNGFLLFLVILVPYPTLLISKFLLTPSAKTACAVYAVVFLIINSGYNWLWFAVSHNRKLDANIKDKKKKSVTRNYLTGIPIYPIVLMCCQSINPYVSAYIMPVAWVFWGKE